MEQVLGHVRRQGASRSSPTPAASTRPGAPTRCASIADKLGVTVNVAHIEGDDLLDRIDGLRPHLANLDTGAAADRRPGERQRLPRRVGHRPGAGRGRRRRRVPAGHRRRRRRRPGGVVVGLVADRLGPPGRRRRGRPRHRVRRPDDRRQLRLLRRARRPARSRSASRSPRSTTTAPASSPSTPAPAARSPSTPSRPSCCTRSRRPPTPTPTSSPASTRSASTRSAPTGCASAACAASRRRRPPRSPSTTRAASATR